MPAKKLRAAVAAFVVAALLPISAATAMPAGGQRPTLDSSTFLSAVENLGSSLWRMCCEVLAKAGIRADQNGNH